METGQGRLCHALLLLILNCEKIYNQEEKQVIKAIMHGCNGKMGQVVSRLVGEDPSIEIVAGIDISDIVNNAYPVFKTLEECNIPADVVIDFSNASVIDKLLDTCTERKLPVVLCTTGLTNGQLQHVESASKETAVLRSANMSLGINLLMKLLKDAAKVLYPAGYDIEIVEKHHNQKLDAPSGTAIALADSINEELDRDCEYVYDRSGRREKRRREEIGISAVRGGTITGQHNVIFAGEDEVIEFQHTAYSKAVFGKGAVEAAKFLAGKSAGLYQMSDVIQL